MWFDFLRSPSRACGLLAAALLIGVAVEGRAQQEQPIASSGLFVSFEGDQPGITMASVLKQVSDNSGLLKDDKLPVVERPIKSGDTVCKLLTDIGYPPPCTKEVLDLVELLNPKTKPVEQGLQLNQTIFLPNPALITKYSVSRHFLPGNTGGKPEAQDILKNWTALNAKSLEPNPSNGGDVYPHIQYDAYRIFVGTKTDEDSKKLLSLLAAKNNVSNVKIDVIPSAQTEEKQHSAPIIKKEAEWAVQCLGGQLFETIYNYRDYSDYDQDARVPADRNPDQARAPVHIVDGPLHGSAPNFSADIADAPAVQCKWIGFSTPLHHATHLASIIASRNKHAGFVGLSGGADIQAFNWLIPQGNISVPATPDRAIRLGDKLSKTGTQGLPLHTYLIPSTISSPGSPLAIAHDNPNDRFGEVVATRIAQTNNLFVISAGQTDGSGSMPQELSPKSPLSPQNLGDLLTVLVVTACDPCTKTDAKIWKDANYSAASSQSDAYYVHVAAPGGGPIVGWVSDTELSASSGTSQAAAYVAGVAASMISRYKDAYASPDAIKRRIQATSEPSNWSPDDGKKLSAGAVDPVVALLDPSKHWLKRAGGKWEAVRIKSIFDASRQIQATDALGTTTIRANSMMRFVRSEAQGGDPRWDIYYEPSVNKAGSAPAAVVTRLRNVSAPDGTIVLCDGPQPQLKWSDVQDLLLAVGGVDDDGCSRQ